jgi:hypothetical protein
MTKFMAVKIHYDHRSRLPAHLKYSALPTEEEYHEYLDLYQEEGIGGAGFHECLNFQIPEDGSVKMYLPPNYIPGDINEEYVIFSFTYRQDGERPDSIVGVHAMARLLSKDGVLRRGLPALTGIDALFYQVEAPAEAVTLFTPSLDYKRLQGRYTRRFSQWGFGLRYMQEEHASHIVWDAIATASAYLERATAAEAIVVERQIRVLRRIAARYQLDMPEAGGIDLARGAGSDLPLPDPKIGWLGEKLVYENELEHAKNLELPSSSVEWISQSEPHSPFDIKSVRVKDGVHKEHFIEVKTTTSASDWNVFVSAQQVEFFKCHDDCATFKFVILDEQAGPQIREFTWSEVTSKFSLEPIKFKLRKR